MREGSGVIRTDSGPAVDKHKGCLLWGARCSPCPLLKQVIFSQTFNTQTSLIWFLSWSQMGIRACKQMNSRAAYLLLAANSKYKGVREKTQELLCPGVSNLFCSSLCVPTAFEGTSPSYLSCRKVCPVSLFDLYLQRCHFFFATDQVCLLINALSLTGHWWWHRDFHLPEMGPRGEQWEGSPTSCCGYHSCSCTSQSPSWAAHMVRMPISGSTPHLHTSPPRPALLYHPNSMHVPLFQPTVSIHPIREPSQSSPNNHKFSATQQHPIPVQCNCSSTLPASCHALSWLTTLPCLSFSEQSVLLISWCFKSLFLL